ncbi:unnamed protein product [Cylindrotheca closterium]|uniref:GRIP domain-containing protein n=1 Tax=Cylindrotheca closterium TaxID=2856 RepID=A0AAD2FIF0_9STRA|nr:unnamed protein product [Cylindrotheca closterium]
MWGNLAGRLGANDLNSTLQKIGNAVAPPPGEDDYDDDDDEEEEYDEEYDDYEDEDEDYDDGGGVGHGGLGFVGLISRVLDDNKEIDEAEVDDDLDDEVEGENNDESLIPSNAALSHATIGKNDRKDTSGHTATLPNTVEVKEDSAKHTDPVIPTNDDIYMKSERVPVQVDSNSTAEFGSSKSIGNPAISVQHKGLSEKKSTLGPGNVPKRSVDNATIPAAGSSDNTSPLIPETSRAELHDPAPQKLSTQGLEKGDHDTWSGDSSLDRRIDTVATTRATEDEKEPEKSISASPKYEDMVPSSTSKTSIVATTKSVSQRSQVNAPGSTSEIDRSNVPEQVSGQSGILPNELMHDGLAMENKRLMEELNKAQEKIAELQERASQDEKHVNSAREELMVAFQEKEARLLRATTEEHHQEIMRIEQERQLEMHSLNEQIAKVRTQLVTQQTKFKAIIEESDARAERAEANLAASQKAHEGQLVQHQKREERSVRSAEDKVAHTLALLDERNDQIADLKELLRDLESKMTKHQEGEEEAEAEADELQDHVDELEHECEELKVRVAQLEEEAEKYSGMQMELTVLREERDRERKHNENVVESAMQSNTRIETERDEAISELRDVKIQLAASTADLEIARADVDRMTVANNNLSDALEAFQDERRAELELLEQQRAEAEKALASSHNAAIAALRDAHNHELKKLQDVADTAVRHKMDELRSLETHINKLKSENTQMRRSLDEAIYRLQTSQEDVIDRTLMKNILLDWCTMKDKGKRQQVLELMASVLHFNEDERDKVHLTHMDIESVRSRVVGAIAAPLPPSKTDVDALEGANVREKFLSFMLAETDEGF